jgi:hypothetical protein
MPNLRDKVLFLKEAPVALPSNINPSCAGMLGR